MKTPSNVYRCVFLGNENIYFVMSCSDASTPAKARALAATLLGPNWGVDPKFSVVRESYHGTVGYSFRGFDGDVYRCTSYDSRQGFWMESPERRTNVSERAIGRTFHRVYTEDAS